MRNSDAKAEEEKSAKKVYSSPKLTVFGTVRDLTKKVATHGQMDTGGIFPRTHTAA